MVKLAYVDSVVILVFLLNSTLGQQCDITTVVNKQCSPTETCIPTKDPKYGLCQCLPGFVRVNNSHCENVTKSNDLSIPKSSSLIDEDADNGSGHVVAGILIPLFLITIVICGVYFSRKYHVMGYIRSKLYQRNSNYDEVMIGQDLDDDDPPLR
ncbi:hypothetical protein ILUMI_20793 [Ignelater luminosus]|uniref:EGF-like domain-containing protein n=1 Tax=Ignelater luminosus TaxID=2038154 RepID=A0A8K0CDG9_IGNLU|nr:hypothetical protein ILUMI_20793 [Ignelater luminosus]